MNNKIKLIGLFNESAANEEMPKRIKFEGDIFELDEDNAYKSSENGNFLTDSINFNLSNLNDYVEILEYEEEIEFDLDKKSKTILTKKEIEQLWEITNKGIDLEDIVKICDEMYEIMKPVFDLYAKNVKTYLKFKEGK